jgi:hypothetical protein
MATRILYAMALASPYSPAIDFSSSCVRYILYC